MILSILSWRLIWEFLAPAKEGKELTVDEKSHDWICLEAKKRLWVSEEVAYQCQQNGRRRNFVTAVRMQATLDYDYETIGECLGYAMRGIREVLNRRAADYLEAGTFEYLDEDVVERVKDAPITNDGSERVFGVLDFVKKMFGNISDTNAATFVQAKINKTWDWWDELPGKARTREQKWYSYKRRVQGFRKMVKVGEKAEREQRVAKQMADAMRAKQKKSVREAKNAKVRSVALLNKVQLELALLKGGSKQKLLKDQLRHYQVLGDDYKFVTLSGRVTDLKQRVLECIQISQRSAQA
jgi:hypothetical protein